MLSRYCVRAASSRDRRDRRTVATGSSEGTMNLFTMTLFCITCSTFAEEFCSAVFIVWWYWVLAMLMVFSPSTQHAQRAVEQFVGDRDHFHVRLVHLLVRHERDGFF